MMNRHIFVKKGGKVAEKKKQRQAPEIVLKEYGLFFSDVLLHMPIPTQEQMDKARERNPKDFDDLHSMRLGTASERIRARNVLLTRNYALVNFFAKKGMRRVEDPVIRSWDLLHEGMIAFMRSLESFDYTLGGKLSSYVSLSILRDIQRFIDNSGTIRIPVHVHEEIRKLRAMQVRLSRLRGKTVGFIEAAEEIDGISEEKARERWYTYHRVMHATRSRQHLQGQRKDDRDSNSFWSMRNAAEVADTLSPGTDAYCIDQELVVQVNKLLATLSRREEGVIRMRFGIGYEREYTLEEIGNMVNVTRERIRQIEAFALRKLRFPKRSKKIKSFTPWYEGTSDERIVVPPHSVALLTDTDRAEATLVTEIVEEYFREDEDQDKNGIIYFLLLNECEWDISILLSYIMTQKGHRYISQKSYVEILKLIGSIQEAIDYELQFALDDLSKIVQSELEELS